VTALPRDSKQFFHKEQRALKKMLADWRILPYLRIRATMSQGAADVVIEREGIAGGRCERRNRGAAEGT